MGFGKRKRQGGPRSRDDGPKRARAEGDAEEGAAADGERKDNGIWSSGNLCNPKFDAFYRAQGFITDDADWESYMTSLKTPLPASFRLNPNYQFKDRLRQELFEFSQSIAAVVSAEGEAEARPAVEPLQWFEGGSAYKLGADRRAIRRMEGLEQLHKWMMEHTENGNITRQEAVSMVPPLALDVQPHHRCLDMCAAPGSKTTQILEIIAGAGEQRDDEAGAGPPRGMVVANDADANRAYMLVHQCRRMSTASLVITTHKGQEFPSIRPSGPGGVQRKGCFFDRVLCDVPCSGDGTLRKSPHIWAKWTTGSGVDLHPLQLIIAKRGFELLKPGGLMVYSTCSMSPYEDEAVVAELLRRHPDLELVDGRQFLPKFRCRAGLSTWHVLDDAKVAWKAGDGPSVLPQPAVAASEAPAEPEPEPNKMEVDDPAVDTTELSAELKACVDIGFRLFRSPKDVPENRANLVRRYRASLFPPSAEEAAWMHLELCMRCVPQDEDTGGFFVATLRKKESAAPASEPATATEPTAAAAAQEPEPESEGAAPEAVGVSIGYQKRKKYQRGNNEYQVWDRDQADIVRDFYSLQGLSPDSLFIRDDFSGQKGNGSNSKSVYYFPPVLRELLAGDLDERLKCVSAGLKVLERKPKTSKGEIEYRLVQEGVDLMARHMVGSKRLVTINVQEFCNLLCGGLVSFNTLSEATVAALSQLGPGSLICEYHFDPADRNVEPGSLKAGAGADDSSANHVFRIVCFRGPSRTINVMCSKLDMDSARRQLEALGVYRPKIAASSTRGEGGEATADAEAQEVNDAAVAENAAEEEEDAEALQSR